MAYCIHIIAHGHDYWLIEMTRRCPGDLYSLLIQFSTGYPYAASYVAPFVGREPIGLNDNEVKEFVTRHTVTSESGAALWGFSFGGPVDIPLFVPLATSGDFIEPSPYGRAGVLFLRSPDRNAQDVLYRRLISGKFYSFT